MWFSINVPAVLAMKGLAELVEGKVVHVQNAVHFAYDMQKMRVAALSEHELFQICEFLKKIRLGDVFLNLQRICFDIRRNETQL